MICYSHPVRARMRYGLPWSRNDILYIQCSQQVVRNEDCWARSKEKPLLISLWPLSRPSDAVEKEKWPWTFYLAIDALLTKWKWELSFLPKDIIKLFRLLEGQFVDIRLVSMLSYGLSVSLNLKKWKITIKSLDHFSHLTRRRRFKVLRRMIYRTRVFEHQTNKTENW